MADAPIDVTCEEGIAWLRIDRPEAHNALNVATLEALEDTFPDLRDVRVLILTGTGEKAFAAGADIEYMQELSTETAHEYAKLGHRVTRKFETFPAPTIAAINGYALGGGFELTLACDLRVASERAILGQTEIDLGIIPGWGGTQRLPRIAGEEVARRLIYFGDRIDATDAREYGIVGEVVSHDSLQDRVAEIAQELAEKPQFALRTAKEAINRSHKATDGMAFERRAWSGLFGTHDQREGMAAFLEDREAEFD